MASVKAKALAKKRKPASDSAMDEQDQGYDNTANSDDREDNMSDEEKGELAAAQAVNTARENANSAFKSGGRMQNEEFNRSSKAAALARAKKNKAK